nr:methyltransferase domain-containing protein [uncultured Sulfurimonas sp.]
MKNKIIALLQARTDSTRLPRKVLRDILNKPMIIHQLERTNKSKYIDKLILLTSEETSDDELSKVVEYNGFNIFRGDKNNVLKRFYDSLVNIELKDDDIIVRLTGDCPLHDSSIIDESIEAFINNKCDYLANCINPVYPDGLDVEVFNYKSLKLAYKNATKQSELEHVTPYIRNHSELTIKNLDKIPIYPKWRLTVDEESDFTLITKVYEHFNSTYFSFQDTINFLEKNAYLLKLNKSIDRNEGYIKSLKEDRIQGEKYIEEDSDKWFERNKDTSHNCFTEYLLNLIPKERLKQFDLAEFGVGHGNHINLLSHYTHRIDGYDGSKKSIDKLKLLQDRDQNINGKVVNLGDHFELLSNYDLIIYGFFTYMITNEEFKTLVHNTKKHLKKGGYIYIYDFLSNQNKNSINAHNQNFYVFKRNLKYYLKELSDFQLIDFRKFDNRKLKDYLLSNSNCIDTEIESDDYNWTFSALFKLKD